MKLSRSIDLIKGPNGDKRRAMLSFARSLALPLMVLGATMVSGHVSGAPVAAFEQRQGPLPRVARILAAGMPLKIVAFGSSSTEGIGASSPAASYPSQLERELVERLPDARPEVINRGVGGQDADEMSARLPAVLAEHPDLVIWQTGSNDPLRGVPLERFEAETRAGIVAIRQTGADVMLMEPQLCRRLTAQSNADRYRDALRRIGDGMNVPVIRRYDLMQSWLDKGILTPAQMLSADGLHMADAGYALLAKNVAERIIAAAADSGRLGTSQR